jgi:flagellar basal-body rod protein FlgF
LGKTNEIAAQGLFRQEQRLNVLSNNLSNVQTAGYKKDFPVFSKILTQAADGQKGWITQSSATLLQQGDLQRTGNDLNAAVEGEGFFKVKTPWGVRYTRNGNFKLNGEGTLVDGNGFAIMGRRDEIQIRGKSVQIQPNGSIQVDGQEVDQIGLVTFPDLNRLRKEGYSYFAVEEGQEEMEVRGSQIVQGSLEMANVNAIEEMIQLIDAQRSFESCQKIIQASDAMDSKVVNDLGRV